MKKYIIRFLVFLVAFAIIFLSLINANNHLESGESIAFTWIARLYTYAPLIIILLLVIIIILLIKKK